MSTKTTAPTKKAAPRKKTAAKPALGTAQDQRLAKAMAAYHTAVARIETAETKADEALLRLHTTIDKEDRTFGHLAGLISTPGEEITMEGARKRVIAAEKRLGRTVERGRRGPRAQG